MSTRVLLLVIALSLSLVPKYLTAQAANYETRFKIAREYQGSGKYDEALKAFQDLDRDFPGNVDVKLSLAQAFRALQKTDEAIKVYEEILKIDPDNPTAHAQRALVSGKSEHVESAVTQLEQSLDIDANNVEAYINLGRVYGRQKRIEEAEGVYLKALELDPDNVDALNALANLYYISRQWDKAVKTYHKALRIAPGNKDSLDGLQLILLARKPTTIPRYQYFFSEGSDDILANVPDRRTNRSDFINDIDVPIDDNLLFQFRTEISTESGESAAGLGPFYTYLQVVLAPRIDIELFPWLTGSGRYSINFYDDKSGKLDIAPLIDDNVSNQGYAFLKGTFGPVTILPSFSREQFTFTSQRGGFSEIQEYNNWAIGSTVAVNDYWDLIPSFIYRDYIPAGRNSREIYDFLTRFRFPKLPGIEFGYGFFFATNPTQRPQIFLARFFGEPTDNLLLDFQFTFSNDLAFAPTPTQGYEWKLFASYKLNPRYRLNFEGLGGFQKGGNDTQELSIFAFATILLGKIKIPQSYTPPAESEVEDISESDIVYD